jgi:Ribbon-helix-helix protein, copG family
MTMNTKATRVSTDPANKRPTRQRTHDRLTISLPLSVAAQLRADAKASGSPSVSAYIKETLEQHTRTRTFRDILDEMFRENPMTDAEREWADAILDR